MTHSNYQESNESIFRFNVPLSIVSIAAAALLGWAISLISETESIKIIAGIISGLISALYLLTLSNISSTRSAIVIKYTSWAAFVFTIIVLSLMSIWCETPEYFIISMSLLALGFIACVYMVAKSDQ